MKVTFALNLVQMARARAMIVVSGQPDLLWEIHENGERNPCFNSDQSMRLDGDRLTYSGQRHPLRRDGGIKILAEIAGHNPRELSVISYETTDVRLLWWETLDEYLREKATKEEVITYLLTRADGKADRRQYINPMAAKAFQQPELQAAVFAIRAGQKDQILSASFSAAVLKEAREIIAMIKRC